MTIKQYVEIKDIFDKLADICNVKDKEKYFKYAGMYDKIPDEQMILKRLCSSLQNSGHMRNTVKFNDKNSNNSKHIEKVLFDFDSKKILHNYANWKEIYNALTNNGKDDNGDKKNKETNWEKYAKGIFDGVIYLHNNNGYIEIKSLCTPPSNNITDRIKQLQNIHKQIHGLGLALTCDWLKECGCMWLAKPDVHIKEVLKVLSGEDNIKDTKVIELAYKYASQLQSFDNNMTAYKLDRMIWLISSGNFFYDDITVGRDTIIKRI